MSSKTSESEYRNSQLIIAAIYLLLICFLGIATANAAASGDRTSTSLHYSDGGRSKIQTPTKTVDNFEPLKIEGVRDKSPSSVRTGKSDSTTTTSKSGSEDFWFYVADVFLFGDDDNDGYFHGIDLLFDVDTVWSAFDVYAVTYLSYEGGPWNEYAATEDFTLFGSSADDEYNIVTELESGYPAGSYDLLIEIFDAETGEYLTGFGPEETSALAFMPLEDFNRDAPYFDVPIATSHGHAGGSTGVWMLMVLLLALTFRRATAASRR